jgi:4-nitrophenyl phosphatase
MQSGFVFDIISPIMKKNTSPEKLNIKGLILDMDGVLWRDAAPLGDLESIFNKISNLGLRLVLATNNASRVPEQYVEKLAGFGVKIKPRQVITSGIATANYLLKKFPDGGDVTIVGEEPLRHLFRSYGFKPDGTNPIALVAALDRGLNYSKLTEATLLIRRGVPFIGTNPDKSFPIEEGEAPGAGAILAALEAATGVSPVIIGKPQSPMFKLALERLRTKPEETMVVGDRLETDIKGAQNIGCKSALVLSGVSTIKNAQKWQPPPDLISPDLTSLIELLSEYLAFRQSSKCI